VSAAPTARAGGLGAEGDSTYRLAEEAIRAGEFPRARELGRSTEREAAEGRELYPMFVERAREFLVREGIPPERVDAEQRRIEATLRLPDGTAFDLEAGWASYLADLDAFEAACDRGEGPLALELLERARLAWRVTHDRACDLVYGLLDVAQRLLGEERIGGMWDHLMDPLYASRDRYDVRTAPWGRSVEALVRDAAVSLRGHLSGPDRNGEVEIEELPDRFVVRFDPCGSGGRTLRPDPAEGGPPRMDPPFNYAVTTAEHDWAWNTRGICLYCVHCCQLQERVPILRLGYPVRVVDPPIWPDGAERTCSWTIYKDPALVPDEVYRRVGLERHRSPEG
jgi:hypothetical protein